MRYTHVLFDLDGTITDSGEGIRKSVIYALKHFGIEETDITKLNKFVGPPLHSSFENYYGFDTQRCDEAIETYREYYKEKGIFECSVYDGVEDTLTKLREDGRSLCLATSKPEHLARRVLDHFGLTGYFDFIGGATTDRDRSEKNQVIEYVLDEAGLHDHKDAMIMVGDTRFDVLGAAKVGLNTIGVTYGYGSKEELIESGAYATIDKPYELIKILE